MKPICSLAIKALAALVTVAGIAVPSHADFTISNANIAIGIDDSTNPGNLISVFEGVGGRLDTGGPHDFWYDPILETGFARTSIAVRDSLGVNLGIRTSGLGWSVPPTVTRQTDPGVSDSAVIEGEPIADVFYRRTVRIDAGTKYARVTDTFRNDRAIIIVPGVLENMNPLSPSSNISTFNDVSSVLRLGDFASASIFPDNTLTVGFGSDNLAYLFSAGGGQGSLNPFTLTVFDPNGALGDSTLQSASNFGLLLPGQEVSRTWFISFGSTKAEAIAVYVAATGASVFEIGPVGDQDVDEHVEMVVSVPINNPGGNPVTWTVDGPAGMTIDSVGVVRWTPGELDGGNVYPVEVQADNGSGTATTSFDVTVFETNTPPTITDRPDQTVAEGSIVSVDFDATDPDVPVNSLTFTLVSGPAGATVNINTGLFEWTTDEADGPGVYPVTVRVRDNGNGLLTDETTFSITVEEVNLAPTVGAIADQTVMAGATLSLTATATDPDLPANGLTFSLALGAPAGATIDGNTGEFNWTPGIGDVGDHTITVRVTDDGDPAMSDTEDFTVHVGAASLNVQYTGAHSGEYSDPTTLSARITDDLGNPIPGLDLSFTLGTFIGSDTTDANGVASVSSILDQAAGMPGVTIDFAGNGTFEAFTHHEAYEILREKVVVTYYGDQNVVNGSNQVTKGAVRFFASAHQEDDGYPGDFSNVTLQYEGFLDGNPGPTPDVFAGPVPIDANGRTAIFKSVSIGSYTFYIETTPNDYWRVVPDVEFTLNVGLNGGPREASGSGWIPFGAGNGHGSYNFKAAYTQSKEVGRSSFEYIGADGFTYQVTLTSWFQGALIFGVGPEKWKSAFTGFATVRKTQVATGQTTVFEDCPVTFAAWDGGRALPTMPDAYGIMVLDHHGLIWLETPEVLNVGGGNITIK
ncbi:MAG: putative Ig domain-containing protein [Armatimonadota bacterium]|nr:putative Ig domain-containing protein [Armatimonadota bacterium]